MTYSISEFSIGAAGAHVRLPVFAVSEGAAKREEKNVARMNAFYKSLADCVEKFVSSEDFPAGGRYRAEGVCRSGEDEEEVTVTVALSLHHRGRCSARRTLCHTWRDGVII